MYSLHKIYCSNVNNAFLLLQRDNGCLPLTVSLCTCVHTIFTLLTEHPIPNANITSSQSNRSMVNKRHLLQSPSGSEVRRSTIEKNDLFEEEDECLGGHIQSAETIAHKGTPSHVYSQVCQFFMHTSLSQRSSIR